MSRRGKKLWESAYLNNATFNDYYYRMKSIAVNRIKWEGWPDTINVRFLERGLFERGSMLIFKDPELGLICTHYNPGARFDIYDEPLERYVTTNNGSYKNTLTKQNSVIIYNNYARRPDHPTAQLFAARIADIQRTTDVNIKGQKTPKLIVADEEQRLAAKNLFMQWDGNEPFMFGDKDMLDHINVEVLDTTAPFVSDKLEIQKHMMFNEYLTYLGIENSNQDKKERLVANEVASNYGLVENSRNVALNSRNDGGEEVERMFGVQAHAIFNSEVKTTVNEPNIGGAQSGEIYN